MNGSKEKIFNLLTICRKAGRMTMGFDSVKESIQTGKAKLPTHINIAGGSVGLSKDSIILLEQIRTIDKRRLREHMGRLDDQQMAMVDDAIAVSFGLPGGNRAT